MMLMVVAVVQPPQKGYDLPSVVRVLEQWMVLLVMVMTSRERLAMVRLFAMDGRRTKPHARRVRVVYARTRPSTRPTPSLSCRSLQ